MAHQTSHFAVFDDERTRRGDERTRRIDERTRLGCNRTRPLRLNPSGQDDAGSTRVFDLFPEVYSACLESLSSNGTIDANRADR